RGTRVSIWLPQDDGPARAPSDAGQAGTARKLATMSPSPPPAPATKTEPNPTGAPKPEAETRGKANGSSPLPMKPASPDVSILVLEDEDSVRSFLVETLAQAGHRVEAVPDVPSGFALLETRSFDLVLTDLALPERSGLAVASQVKSLHPQTPVILITGWG